MFLERPPLRVPAAHRRPLYVAIGLAVVLLLAALFVESAISRAARASVRGQVDAVTPLLLRDAALRGASADPAALERILADHAGEGLRHLALVGESGAKLAAAGEARGTGASRGLPTRAGDRVRVVVPLDEARALLVFELETPIANDISMAGRIVLGVVVAVDALLIALGALFSRSLRAREQLAARLEAGRQLTALGEMSAILAHELRNPLASLKGNAQLLAEVLPGESPHVKKAERVVKEAVRLERLTNDLLELVRTGELRTKEVDPREVIEAAVAAVDPSRVQIRHPASLARHELDPDRLRIALENVVRNATQAATAGAIELTTSEANGSLVITVRDRGPGIPPGDEHAIFQAFRTGKAHGTGLGLAIARRILELHGGSIEASNHDEGGAVFTMTIPPRR